MSSSDPEARVMKMANGGCHPAGHVQLATAAPSRAIVGVEVSNAGYAATGLSELMREQVERRSGQQVLQHLLEGGYLRPQDIEVATRKVWSYSCRSRARATRSIADGN